MDFAFQILYIYFQLTIFPYKLVKLEKLMVLTMKDNQIMHIPFAIRRLKSLRTLNLADNRIKSLPNVFNRMSFETLDVSGEEMFSPPFPEHEPISELLHRDSFRQQPASLWQIAARTVMLKK